VLWGGLAVRHGCGIAWLRGKAEGLRRFASIRPAVFPSSDLVSTISDSERQIYQMQSSTGFDAYWKLYFHLTGPRNE
jgi:hypothetical protein